MRVPPALALPLGGAFRFLNEPSPASDPASGSNRQKPPFPGSSLRRGTLMKHLFSERLCRIEF